MKAKAKQWVSYNGTYYKAGEVFPIKAEDENMLSEYCEIIAEKVKQEDEPIVKRPGRPRKTE